MPTIDGLATGLDTTKIVQAIIAVQQKRIDLLRDKQSQAAGQQAAFQTVQAKLETLRSQAIRLGRSKGSVFDQKTVKSSQEDLLSAVASGQAQPGQYTVRVNSLAQAQQIASQGFDDPNSAITQGTFAIRVGSGATTTVTIDGTNNTLQGLADAINNAGAGVTASVISDGSASGTQPYRLLLTANQTGTANSISITNNLAADSGAAHRPELGGNYVGAAVTGGDYTGGSIPVSNAGAGGYSGTANDTYTFTVVNSGTVGTDDGIQISYADGSGDHTGTITVNSGDAGIFQAVAEGIQVKFDAGTLVAGDKFTVDGFVPTVQAAADASITLGSGTGALTIQSASNQVDGVIDGVTLDLHGANTAQPVTITVAADKESIRKGVSDFVDAYNDVIDFIDQQVRYEADSGKAGVLLGNQSVLNVQDQVRRAVSDPVRGLPSIINRLSTLGVTTNDQGKLDFDPAKVDQAVDGHLKVSLDDIRRLFVLAGPSTSAGVRFVSGSDRTHESDTPVQVDVSQAAEQASITGTNSVAASTVIGGGNNTVSVRIDGQVSGTITLASGTYTRQQLAQELQGKINGDSALSTRQVSVSVAGDKLRISSQAYGYASEATVASGSALADLGFAGSETDRGQDVVGKFVVDGKDEAAVGRGQFLTGSAANAHTADLQVRVTLTSSQIQNGPEASLTVTRGVASRLSTVLGNLLDPVNGKLKAINQGFQQNVDDIKKEVDRQSQLLQTQQEDLIKRFVALETAVSQLKTTGDFLTAQLSTTLGAKK